MLFAQLRAPLLGVGLLLPQPGAALSGFFMVGHLPGRFGLGVPEVLQHPLLIEDDDENVFLADWGEPATIDGRQVGDVIFSEPYVADPLGSAGISASGPRAMLPAAMVPEREATDPTDPVLELQDRRGRLFKNGAPKPFRYFVREIQPDGTGWASLVLSLAPDQSTQ